MVARGVGLPQSRFASFNLSVASRHVVDKGLPGPYLGCQGLVRQLYNMKEEAKKLSSADQLRQRQERSVPLQDSFHTWLVAQKADTLPRVRSHRPSTTCSISGRLYI
jgi:hypothetical protein